MTVNMRLAYNALVAKGSLAADTAQAAVIAKLDRLAAIVQERQQQAAKGGLLRRLWRGTAPDYSGVKSFYLYGPVGRGKTMIMDLFFAALPPGDKKRLHFNDFMNNVQNRLAACRAAEQAGKIKLPPAGALIRVAEDLAREAHILCCDEFSVTNIADAMILSRLFTALFAQGVVLVATSNVAPQNLYQDGLNRALFLPFINVLQQQAEICSLETPTDYRREKGAAAAVPAFITPCDAKAKAQMDRFWRGLTGRNSGEQQEITVSGHKIIIPCAAAIQNTAPEKNGASRMAARFDFADICRRDLAAADYAALAEHYAVFCVENVPLFSEENRNEAKRFILFIDIIYDRHLPLYLSAAAPADRLYTGTAMITEKFEFERTASRLVEMQSEAYGRGQA
ncbi:cell division protein ZapE [Candidatus Tokpelaia sp.]|uniref:cell division protein ZapE n=1 Tax=Candidatus Tokpelaia sp. TaxID=2233777 RepID=UPI001FEFE260|nr:cell division protein ZapE [Candidatus Tokpelaia sp.]